MDLFRSGLRRTPKAQCLQLQSAFSLEDAHLLAGSFHFHKRTLAAGARKPVDLAHRSCLAGKFKGLLTGGPDCFYKLLFDFILFIRLRLLCPETPMCGRFFSRCSFGCFLFWCFFHAFPEPHCRWLHWQSGPVAVADFPVRRSFLVFCNPVNDIFHTVTSLIDLLPLPRLPSWRPCQPMPPVW